MRRNVFNEAYCHNADEVAEEVEKYLDRGEPGLVPQQVHITNLHDANGRDKAGCEVVDNESGDTVCYIEAQTLADVYVIARQTGIEIIGG